MSREQKSNGSVLGVQEIEGLLRHADGSPDIAAYAKLAHHERDKAVAALATEAIRRVRETVSVIRASLAPPVTSERVSGKRHAAARR
jgi:hypothetical protein